jgi:hypothetical protein
VTVQAECLKFLVKNNHKACWGWTWRGSARLGVAGLVGATHGRVFFDLCLRPRLASSGQAGLGSVRQGKARLGMSGLGGIGLGMARRGFSLISIDGKVLLCSALLGSVGRGVARLG